MGASRVLLIGIGFYDYEEAIIKQLERYNFEVDYFIEFPKTRLMNLALRFNLNKLKEKLIRSNNLNILSKSGLNYEYILVIKCEYITIELLKELRIRSKRGKLILYLWDSLKRINGIQEKLGIFDLVFSFDRTDTINNSKLIFHPLFFRFRDTTSNLVSKEIIYDIYFLGLDHSDRFELLKNLNIKCRELGLKTYFVLYTGRFSFFLRCLRNPSFIRYRNYFTFNTISANLNFELMLNSKCVVDLNHPDQSGLTMRTLEIIASGRKMITTNVDVKNYDFFNSENILIIDRNNPKVNIDFFDKCYVDLPEEVIERYSISSWIDKILNFQ
jgi:hypothetical protein